MDYSEMNNRSRERLSHFTQNLTEDELSMPAGDGWTVSAILAHLAFWDFRVLNLIRRWNIEGVGGSPIDIDNINDAMKPLCLAVPGREAITLARQAAEAVDTALAGLPDELMPAINLLVHEKKFRLDRSLHRQEHLNQIEKILVQSGRR